MWWSFSKRAKKAEKLLAEIKLSVDALGAITEGMLGQAKKQNQILSSLVEVNTNLHTIIHDEMAFRKVAEEEEAKVTPGDEKY